LFLITTFVWLAMPGSPNFVGEFMILLGTFNAKLPIAVLAMLGVVGAAAYALRAFITTMHNRVGPRVTSYDISLADALPVAGLLAVILVLAFYPQFGLRRSQSTVNQAVAPAQAQLAAQAASAHKVAQVP